MKTGERKKGTDHEGISKLRKGNETSDEPSWTKWPQKLPAPQRIQRERPTQGASRERSAE